MKTCGIEGCDRPNLARQMCSMHYARERRTGSATEVQRVVGGTVVDRLRHRTVEKGGCWLFQGAILHYDRGDGNNYRGIRLAGGGAYVSAHVAAYTALVGPIPEGMEIHHMCLHKSCWNPAHLVMLTDAEHNRIHHARAEGRCRNGHDLTAQNTRLRADGFAVCKACEKDSSRSWKEKNPERKRELNRESARRIYARKKAEREQEEAQQSEG